MQDQPDLTKRQREVIERLEQGMSVKHISTDMGISRNAVYQHVERLRQRGVLSDEYTPSGRPPRSELPPPVEGLELGAAVPAPGFSPGGAGVTIAGSELSELRDAQRGDEGYAGRIEAAIASADIAVLAYELGRLDAAGERTVITGMIESALARHRVIERD
ncbi:hypothetical protein BH10ACT11_BH10ACT11_10210 [soil metagenome]